MFNGVNNIEKFGNIFKNITNKENTKLFIVITDNVMKWLILSNLSLPNTSFKMSSKYIF